jgi:hypothetical protein
LYFNQFIYFFETETLGLLHANLEINTLLLVEELLSELEVPLYRIGFFHLFALGNLWKQTHHFLEYLEVEVKSYGFLGFLQMLKDHRHLNCNFEFDLFGLGKRVLLKQALESRKKLFWRRVRRTRHNNEECFDLVNFVVDL